MSVERARAWLRSRRARGAFDRGVRTAMGKQMKASGDEGPAELHSLYAAGKQAVDEGVDHDSAFAGAYSQWEFDQIAAEHPSMADGEVLDLVNERMSAAGLDPAELDNANNDDADRDAADEDDADDDDADYDEAEEDEADWDE